MNNLKSKISNIFSFLDLKNSKIQWLFSQNCISRHKTERRISEISAQVDQQLLNDKKKCEPFSFSLDESTDIQDKLEMAVFVRYLASDGILK